LKLEVNLTDSIDYTKMLFNDLGRLLILIILDIIPIVNFIVAGYAANVIKQPKGSKELPPLTNYFDLWIQGLKIVVASIIIMIIPIILIGPSVVLFVIAAWIDVSFLPTVGGFLAIVMLLIGLLLAFFLSIILGMAIVNMVKHNDFGKAFAFGEILNIIGKIGWGSYIVWLIVIFIVSVIVSAIGGIPVIGWLLSLILAPLFAVFAARSASLTYMEGTTTPEPAAAPPTTEEEQ
jgi:hypothetical protein